MDLGLLFGSILCVPVRRDPGSKSIYSVFNKYDQNLPPGGQKVFHTAKK